MKYLNRKHEDEMVQNGLMWNRCGSWLDFWFFWHFPKRRDVQFHFGIRIGRAAYPKQKWIDYSFRQRRILTEA